MQKILKLFVFLFILSFASSKSYSQVTVGITVRVAPPELPVYVQPVCPGDDFMWTPGYWSYGDDGYYWVPGVWIIAPTPGYLWTPGYWGYSGAYYGWHGGYWGPHIGFYGGVNYGYGYGGIGFVGGMWQAGHFHYNTAVMNVNTTVVHNTYINRTVINNTTIVNNHTSFNGPGGINAQPRPEDRIAMNERHVQPTTMQLSHQQMARNDRSQYVSVNHGRPATVAMNTVNGNHFNPQGHVTQAGSVRQPQQTRTNLNQNVTPVHPSTQTPRNQASTNHALTTSPSHENTVRPMPQHQTPQTPHQQTHSDRTPTNQPVHQPAPHQQQPHQPEPHQRER